MTEDKDEYTGFGVKNVRKKGYLLKRLWFAIRPYAKWWIPILVVAFPGPFLVSYFQSLPSMDFHLDRATFARSIDDKMPYGRFSFSVTSTSTSDHPFSIDSVSFNAISRSYIFKADSSRFRLDAKQVIQFVIDEYDLFFDTILAMPFNPRTIDFSIFATIGGESKRSDYTDHHVQKCLFIQHPDIYPPTGYDSLFSTELHSYYGDSLKTHKTYMSRHTAYFVGFSWGRANQKVWVDRVWYDDETFLPTYGGIYLYNESGSDAWIPGIVPADVFDTSSRYSISKTTGITADFDYLSTSEFVMTTFSPNPKRDTIRDKKLKNIQYLVTSDSLDDKVLEVRDSLRSNGYRVSIKLSDINLTLSQLIRGNSGDTAFGFDLIRGIVANIDYLNEALESGKCIVFDFGSREPLLTNEICALVSICLSEDVVLVPFDEPSANNIFGDYIQAEIQRIIFLKTNDNLRIIRSNDQDSLDGLKIILISKIQGDSILSDSKVMYQRITIGAMKNGSVNIEE